MLRFPIVELDVDVKEALQGTEGDPNDTNRFVTNSDTRLTVATTIKDGLMSLSDKTKLDGIEALADVTDSTNVDAAGAVMNSDTSTASMSFVIDEDTMASNLDTKIPTQQSVKAYVDTFYQPISAKGAASGYCPLDASTKVAATYLYLASSPPATISATNTTGTATDLARQDHTHSHGTHSDGSYHAVATQSVAGFLQPSDKVKLDTLVGEGSGTIGIVQVDSYRTRLDTTSTTYVLYREFTTSSIPAGTYRLGWTYQWTGSSVSSSVDIEVRFDGSPIDTVNITPRASTDRNSNGGFYYTTTVTTAAHTLSIYVKSSAAGKTATVFQSDLEFWRAYV